ncbi:MAG: hypothetical protein HKN13_05710, partial [Rhodothermales bacterium]|nr:hypothetical protein [Rhodothermales bacterium]
MGKLALLVAAAAIMGSSMLLFQVDRTSVATDEKQSERQGQIIAREIARTGQNVLLSRVKQLQAANPDEALENIVEMANGSNGKVSGSYGGGTYEARVILTSASTYSVEAIGSFQAGGHEVTSERVSETEVLAEGTLEVPQKSILNVKFLESMAGYCSAIFVQRLTPSVSGTGDVSYTEHTPEMVFSPGNNRDGATVQPSDIIIDAGERVNFILAVDADFNCEKRGQDVNVNDAMFDYTRDALKNEIDPESDDLSEGKYAMIQENPNSPGVWRIAFEDLVMSNAKLTDVKANSYGGSWNRTTKTYGGTGWNHVDSDGYWRLQDHGNKPDFSDQV